MGTTAVRGGDEIGDQGEKEKQPHPVSQCGISRFTLMLLMSGKDYEWLACYGKLMRASVPRAIGE